MSWGCRGSPPKRLGFHDRGILRDGMKAAIVVLNSETVHATTTFEDHKQFPTDIDHVLVSGNASSATAPHRSTPRPRPAAPVGSSNERFAFHSRTTMAEGAIVVFYAVRA